jgi:hypothetical protein
VFSADAAALGALPAWLLQHAQAMHCESETSEADETSPLPSRASRLATVVWHWLLPSASPLVVTAVCAPAQRLGRCRVESCLATVVQWLLPNCFPLVVTAIVRQPTSCAGAVSEAVWPQVWLLAASECFPLVVTAVWAPAQRLGRCRVCSSHSSCMVSPAPRQTGVVHMAASGTCAS